MPSLEEAASRTQSALTAVLHSAVETISDHQQVTFTLYVRQVLPLDGYVFWIRASEVNADVLRRRGLEDAPKTLTIAGSLHRQVVSEQTETASQSVNHLIFTPLAPIDDFNVAHPVAMYLGDYEGVRFSFSRMESQYTPSGIFHYRGTAVRASLKPQIIDHIDEIDNTLILSNSIPVWMSLNRFAPVYPSWLSPSDEPPPYIVADVRETRPIQIAADGFIRSQLVQDRVRVTLYGLNNAQSLAYVDYIVNTALEEETFGITNSPVVVDDKLSQVEINALAKKKHVDFDINY